MAYVIAKGGYQDLKLAAGNDTYDFSEITGPSQARISWVDVKKNGSTPFVGNFSSQDLKKNGVTLAPYQMIDAFGSVDTVVGRGSNPPDLTFLSGPTDDFVSFAGNYATGLIWAMTPSSGNDTVLGGNNFSSVDLSQFTNLSLVLTGDKGFLKLGTDSSLSYENINQWRLWTGSYSVKSSSNDESFNIWGSSANLDLSSGGSDTIVFVLWGQNNVTIAGLSSDDAVTFSDLNLSTTPLALQYDSAANTTKFQVKKSSSEFVNVTLNGTYQIDRIQNNKVYFTGTASSTTPTNNTGAVSTSTPSYSVRSTTDSVNEGGTANFVLTTSGVDAGTEVNYQISGINSKDIVGGSLTGNIVIGKSGTASLSIPLSADSATEATETLTLTIQGKTTSVSVNDTSTAVDQSNIATGGTESALRLSASATTVNEGSVAKFSVIGPASVSGKTFPYLISGIAAEDLTSGEVSGRVTLDDLGMGTVSIPIAADLATEGNEVMLVTIGSQVATITINDTSKSGSEYYISASDGLVNEGKVVTFTVSAANAVAGTKLAYTISGGGVTPKDIGNGKLSGSVSIGSDTSAIITVPIAADKTTEGDEELTLTLTGKGVSETITIEDTSTEVVVAATYSLSAVDSSIEEGSEAEFLIETDPSEAGKQFKWTVTGLSAADVVGKKLSGTVVIDDDGTATISIPTATDALIEGNETLTLTVNGQKATVAVLDNNTVTIASVLLESDTSGSSAMYKLSDGMVVIAEAGLYDGDTLEDFVPLKASPSTNYAVPKTVAALISYSDGGYGLLSKTGVVYSEQKFTEDGIAKGKPTKLTASQLLSKETEIGKDLDDDGNIGDAIMAVLDEDGDASQEDSGLFQTLTGSLVVASTELGEGDAISDGLVLMASKTKGFTLKSTQTVLGLAQKESGHWEILIQSGKAISAQTFDAETGLMKGKAVTLKTAQVDAREYYYDIDLTGDGEISLVGQDTTPFGWIS